MFDWDQSNIAHIARNGITPQEAEESITNDPVDLTTEIHKEEVRITSVGKTSAGRLLVVITTEREILSGSSLHFRQPGRIATHT